MNNLHNLKYRPDVDGLRAIAVLAVMVFHIFPRHLMGGFAGVDVFFVISGYLVTGIILDSLSKESFSFIVFYARRIRRLFPALGLVLLGLLGLSWFFLVSEELVLLGKHVFAGATYSSNFVLFSESGYFDKASELKPLLHLWSLAVEEQFYFFWPLIVWLLYSKNLKKLIIALSGFFLLSLFLNLYLVENHQDLAFYILPTRLWELGAGGLLVLLERKGLRHIDVSWLGVPLIIYSFNILNREKNFPGILALLPVLGTSLVIYSSSCGFFNRLLSLRPLVYIGLISYPLYLWHWPLISLANIVYQRNISLSMRLGVLLISFLLAIFTFHFIEKPLKLVKSKSYPILLLVLLSLIGFGGYFLWLSDGFPMRFLEVENLRKTALAFKSTKDTEIGSECIKKFIDIEMCAISNIHKPPTVALIGDSHANHLYPGLKEVLDKRNENIILLAKSGTPPLWGVISKRAPDVMMDDVFEFISKTPSIHTVVLSAIWASYHEENGVPVADIFYKNRTQDKLKPTGLSQEEIFSISLPRTIEKLWQLKKKITVFETIPVLPFHLEKCLPRPYREQPKDCDFSAEIDRGKHRYKEVFAALKKSNTYPLEVFNPSSVMCRESKCNVVRGNMVMYSDDFHLSIDGAVALIKELNF